MKLLFSAALLFIACQTKGAPDDTFSKMKKTILLETGLTLKYIDEGNASDEALILLHGYTDSGRSFQLMLDEIRKKKKTKKFRVIIPDLRGHGESSMPDASFCASNPAQCFSPAAFASDIIALMRQLGIEKAHFAGHSMGSIIAQQLAIHHPSRVATLILIGTTVNGTQSAVIHDFLIGNMLSEWKTLFLAQGRGHWPEDAYHVTPEQLGADVTSFLKENWVMELGADQGFLNAIFEETIRTKLGTYIGVATALGMVDNRDACTTITNPTLVLWARQDMAFPENEQAEVRQAFLTASRSNNSVFYYKVYGRAPLPQSGVQDTDLGHNLQWIAPRQVANDMLAFIVKGAPEKNLPYLNPQNFSEVLTDDDANHSMIFTRVD
jgi:non-heme chloroperoxidase